MELMGTLSRWLHKNTETPSTDEDISMYREAFKRIVCMKYAYKIDKGNFDFLIRSFVKGDTLILNMKIETIPNDVIFMRSLAGKEITPEIEEKVRKMWEEEDARRS